MMEEFFWWMSKREARIREKAEETSLMREFQELGKYYESRRCPHCKKGFLNDWTGICNNCGYPEFHNETK